MKNISGEIKILRATRENMLNLLNEYSIEQLNKIPNGFNNNLIWNFGHVIVTQQLLCYGLSGLKMYTDNDRVSRFRKGTKPGINITEDEYHELITLANSTIDDLENDYQDELFQEYKIYSTSYNVTLTSIADAIQFNNVHEALHLGTCLALRKLV